MLDRRTHVKLITRPPAYAFDAGAGCLSPSTSVLPCLFDLLFAAIAGALSMVGSAGGSAVGVATLSENLGQLYRSLQWYGKI